VHLTFDYKIQTTTWVRPPARDFVSTNTNFIYVDVWI